MNKTFTGFAIALAWPETFCKQAGAWYDGIMKLVGINRHNHYKVGHAAVILVDNSNGECHYFDFGRYHTPFGHGRVRDKVSDTDLNIVTKACVKSDVIQNIDEILQEIQSNVSCHGTGDLHSSYCLVDYCRAIKKAKALQSISPIKYGPFVLDGTNCSRFVRTVILSGNPNSNRKYRLKLPSTISPTPMVNVKSLGNYKILKTDNPLPEIQQTYSKEFVGTILPPPKINGNIPADAEWISGEGAGSWFDIKAIYDQYLISRYCPSGRIESQGLYVDSSNGLFCINNQYIFQHFNGDNQIRIYQNGIIYIFNKIR